MRIKLGDYGGKIAPTVPDGSRTNPRAAFVDPDNDIGAKGMAIAGQRIDQESAEAKLEERVKAAEAKAAAQEADKVKSMVARANIGGGMADLYDQLANGLRDGTVPKDDIFKRWDEDSQKYIDEAIRGVAPAHQELVKAEVRATGNRLRNTLGDALTKRNQQEIGAGLIELRESLQRNALQDRPKAIDDFTRAIDSKGPIAGMDPAQIAKVKQEFKEQVTFTDLDRRISASQTSAAGLKAAAADLQKPEFADLAPERRNFLEGKIQRNQVHLAQQGEIAERRRLSALDRQSKRLSWYVENGKDIPPAEFNAFVKASKGTEFAGVADALIAEQKAVTELSGLSPFKMKEKIREVETQYGPTPSREQLIHVDKLKRFADRTVKMGTESPLTFAVERGGAQVERLDMAAPASWTQNLAARTAVLTEQAKRTGFAPKGLFPDELQGLSQMLKTAKPEEARQILGMLRQGFGDDKVFKATMQQIAPDNPVMAAGGLAAGRGIESQKDRFLADEIFRGMQLLKPNTKEDGKPGAGGIVKMPLDGDLLKVYATRARDAFADNAEAGDLFFQTARAIYAARTDRAGDMSGVVNSSRWEDSIEAATGGFTKKNGRWAVMPHGYSEASFRDGLAARAEHVVASGRLDNGWTGSVLAGLPLQNVGDGRYIFRIGDGQLVDKDRRPVVIDFNEPAPFRPSGDPEVDLRPVTRKGRSSGL